MQLHYAICSSEDTRLFEHAKPKLKMAIPKAEGRDDFNALIDELVPKLKEGGRDYSREAALLTPGIDKARLQKAVNKRTVYWDALPALRKVLEARSKATRSN